MCSKSRSGESTDVSRPRNSQVRRSCSSGWSRQRSSWRMSDLLAGKDLEQPADLLRVVAAVHRVGQLVQLNLSAVALRHSKLASQPGAKAVHRIAQRDQDSRLGGSLSEQGKRPVVVHVARGPLARLLAFGAWEVLVIALDEVVRHLAVPELVEVMKLLAQAADADDVRMLPDCPAPPPRRATALDADADEIGGPGLPVVGTARRRWHRCPTGYRPGRRILGRGVGRLGHAS